MGEAEKSGDKISALKTVRNENVQSGTLSIAYRALKILPPTNGVKSCWVRVAENDLELLRASKSYVLQLTPFLANPFFMLVLELFASWLQS